MYILAWEQEIMRSLQSIPTILAIAGLCLASSVLAANGNGNGNGPADKVDVIMVYDAKPDKAEKDRVRGLGGTTKREFDNFNMRVISVSENALEALGNGKGVRFIAPDREIAGLAMPSHATARVPVAGSANAQFDGDGVGIAVVDSGVGHHGDLPGVTRVHLVTPHTVAKQGTRHDDSARLLYVFDESNGARVFDRSGAAGSVDLVAETDAGYSWNGDKLTLDTPTRFAASGTPEGLLKACSATNAITVEVWIRPDFVTPVV